jgi:ABC-type transport system substrate-binding protein
MDGPEAAINYLLINTLHPPMNDVRVRKAFNYAVDKHAWSKWRKVTKPLTAFTPEGIFPGYPQPRGDQFNPEEGRRLLGEAGYPVIQKRVHLQHAGIKQGNGRVDAGTVETEPWHNHHSAKHGVEDVSKRQSQDGIQRFRAWSMGR